MDEAKAPPPGCTVLVTLLDGTVMEARNRGMEGGELVLTTRDAAPVPDATVVLRWDHAGEAYEAAGVVSTSSRSDATAPAPWGVKVTQGPENARCRRHPRILVTLPVQILGRVSGTGRIAEGVATDISVGGMRVNLTRPAPLVRGDQVEVLLVVDGTVVRCPARVAHTAEDRGDSAVAEYGLVFVGLTPAAVDAVASLVDATLVTRVT
ncbi:MAG: PilZ domain-containing protein [Acidimicrobiia bacterium]|nr:PilZ domain-containing protein [Acidimicrobiia bacterium]